ncbi:unnamed protein product [Rotaria sp. Silwood1]|nr:unnamed protein product [Rotaria sp. Silwood1]
MNGVEKIFCAHGGWVTIAHVAHLTGDSSILTQNISQVLQYLLKRHPRMRSRIRIDDLHEQCHLHEVTLQGPLLSCLLLAIHHCFPLNDKDRLDPFEIEMDFDMRLRLPQSSLTPSSVGFFVGASDFSLDRSLTIHST